MTCLDPVYRRDEAGALRYRDAWTEADGVVEHVGKVGQAGSRKLRPTGTKALPTPEAGLERFTAESLAKGYAPFPPEDCGWVVLQVWTATTNFSHPEDKRMMADLEVFLNDYLLMRGLGYCDGYDVGGIPSNPNYAGGTIVNWFCKVVDATLAASALKGAARAFHLGSNFVIAIRPSASDEYTLFYSPRVSDTTFTL